MKMKTYCVIYFNHICHIEFINPLFLYILLFLNLYYIVSHFIIYDYQVFYVLHITKWLPVSSPVQVQSGDDGEPVV